MHCGAFLIFFSFIAICALCADLDIFQENGFETGTNLASSDINSLSFLDPGRLDIFGNPDYSSTTLTPEDIASVEESSTDFDQAPEPFDLLAEVNNDACSLPPLGRRIRARDSGPLCSSSSKPILSTDALSPGSSMLSDESWLGLPYWNRKISSYVDANLRVAGRVYCPSDRVIFPSLILSVCSSNIPAFTMPFLDGSLYTLFYGFLSMFSLSHFLPVGDPSEGVSWTYSSTELSYDLTKAERICSLNFLQ